MPSHLHHVVHFATADGSDTPVIACDRTRKNVPVGDYSYITRSVTCGRCQRTNAFNYAADREQRVGSITAELNGMKATYQTTSPSIPTVDWQEVGGDLDVAPEAWLKAHIVICGVDMHLEAIEVVDEEGLQIGICPNLDEILNDYGRGCSPDGHWQTMERNGLTYALFATPYC